MAQGSFFPLQFYSKKTLRKMSRKVLENTNEMCSCPPGHPIILLKWNYFNMATVSVKRSIPKDCPRSERERKFSIACLSPP